MDHGLWRDRIILDEFIVIVHSIEWDVSLLTLYGGEFTFSTQLLTLNHLLTFPPTQHHSFFRNLPHLFIYHKASLRIGSEKPGFQAEWWSFANSILSVRPLIFPFHIVAREWTKSFGFHSRTSHCFVFWDKDTLLLQCQSPWQNYHLVQPRQVGISVAWWCKHWNKLHISWEPQGLRSDFAAVIHW